MDLLLIITALVLAALLIILAKRRTVIEALAVIAFGFVGCETLAIALKVSASGVYAPSVFFSVDALGAIVMLAIGVIGFATTVYSVSYLRSETAKNIVGFKRVKQYFVMLLLFAAAMLSAISAASPIFAWISLEATTLSTAFLISFYNKPAAIEAAWKYLIVNSVGLLLGFFGTMLYFTSLETAGGSGFVSWSLLLANTPHFNRVVAKIAFVFVLIGYGTKVGLAPMHTWLPDAHSKAPAPISAFLSGVLLNVALVIILRFKNITDASAGATFSQNLLVLFGALSILFAALIILTQKNYKRLIAYSSIENMGVMALGFGFGGQGVFAAILHMVYNALTKSALFLAAGSLFLKYSSTKIAKVSGALTVLPVTSLIFLTGFLAITGFPPFGIFLTKMLILSAGIKTHPLVTVLALLLMTILFVGFFRHVVALIFGEKPAGIPAGEASIWTVIPPLVLMSLVGYLSFSIPPFLLALIHQAALGYGR